MSTTIASVDVDCPVDMVYNQWTQFESFPEVMEGVEQHPDERVAWRIG